MKIYLVGFMGSGKTTLGRHIAGLTGYDFVDTDRFIEMQEGISIAQIFAERGESTFREMEYQVLQTLQQRDFVIISTGGGLPCHSNNMDMMLGNGKVVYLETSVQSLTNRLIHSHTERPLLKGKTEEELQEYVREKLAQREPVYARAHITIQTEQLSVEKLMQQLELSPRNV